MNSRVFWKLSRFEKMKYTFILDENVYIQSHTCKNIKDSQDNFHSLRLILKILEECHKVGLTNELMIKYQEKSKIFKKKGKIYPNVPKIWNKILYRSDKYRLSDNHLKDLPTNLQHDRHVIEPTIFLQGILVTTDDKLRRRVTEWAKKKGISLNIKSPEEALTFT